MKYQMYTKDLHICYFIYKFNMKIIKGMIFPAIIMKEGEIACSSAEKKPRNCGALMLVFVALLFVFLEQFILDVGRNLCIFGKGHLVGGTAAGE